MNARPAREFANGCLPRRLGQGNEMMTNLHLRTGAARPVTDLALALGLVGIDAIARLTPHPTSRQV